MTSVVRDALSGAREDADDAAIARGAQPYRAAGVGVAHGVGDQRSEEAAPPRRLSEHHNRVVLRQLDA